MLSGWRFQFLTSVPWLYGVSATYLCGLFPLPWRLMHLGISGFLSALYIQTRTGALQATRYMKCQSVANVLLENKRTDIVSLLRRQPINWTTKLYLCIFTGGARLFVRERKCMASRALSKIADPHSMTVCVVYLGAISHRKVHLKSSATAQHFSFHIRRSISFTFQHKTYKTEGWIPRNLLDSPLLSTFHATHESVEEALLRRDSWANSTSGFPR